PRPNRVMPIDVPALPTLEEAVEGDEIPHDEFSQASHASFVGQRVSILDVAARRSEEHTSELQSRFDLVCRLLLEKKNRCRSSNRDARNATTPRVSLRVGYTPAARLRAIERIPVRRLLSAAAARARRHRHHIESPA